MEGDFRLRCFSHNCSVDYSELNDTLDYYDITFVISGKLSYLMDSTPISLSAGDAIIFSPGQHRFRNTREHTFAEYVSINFFCDENLHLPPTIPNCLTHDIKRLLRQFEAIVKEHTDYKERKQYLVLELLLLTLRELLHLRALNPHVVTILNYIRDHLTDKLTLQDIAKSVSLAPTYCGYLVKRELGATIFELIIRERMELAQQYILDNEKSLQEICYLCGYSDYSYFSKHYKRYTGVLPSQARRTAK